MHEIPTEQLARHLTYLDPEPPLTKELDKWGSHYQSQKIHMYSWVNGQQYTGEGAYSREKGNQKASVMYNRLLNPGCLLWLADALGEKENNLREAVRAASEKDDYRQRCAAFRAVIPWDRICQLYEDFENWRYDKKIIPLLALDERTGYPEIKPGQRKKYLKILHDEENGTQKKSKQTAMNIEIIQ